MGEFMPEGAISELFTTKAALTATALVVLEAGVWTQVGYLPHWLFVLTMVFAALTFIVVNFEVLLCPYVPRVYGAITKTTIVGFVVVLVLAFVWGSEFGMKPFRGEVHAVINSSPVKDKLSFFEALCGDPTAGVSPVIFLMNITVANLQNNPDKINEYSVEASYHPYLPWTWHPLPAIPLNTCKLYSIGPNGPLRTWTSPVKALEFPKGSYLIATPIKKEFLSSALWFVPDQTLETALDRDIPAHTTTRGWAAFGAPQHYMVFSGQGVFFRVILRDNAGESISTVMQTPLCCKGTVDTYLGYLVPGREVVDLSNATVKPFGEQIPW
jgi:hypothetical protein